MGFWKKFKAALGFARAISPDVDKLAKEAEETARKAEAAAEAAKQVTEVVKEVKQLASDVPRVLETLWRPGSRPEFGGDFVLFRGDTPVRDYQGDLARHSCEAGNPLPPGFARGDVWRQVDER